MTRMTRLRLLAVPLAVAAVAVGGIVAAGAASAMPAAPAARAPIFIRPPRPQTFDVILNSAGGNSVSARGPVFIMGGTDQQFGPVFSLFRGATGDSVRVVHAALPAGVVDLRTCTVLITQNDAAWRFVGGTGRDLRASGSGVFDLRAEFSFGLTRRGTCVLTGLTPRQVAFLIVRGPRFGPFSVRAWDVFVQGAGTARVRPLPLPAPSPPVSPSPSSPAPSPSVSAA